MIFLVWFFGLGAILTSAALVRRAKLGDRAVIAVLLAGFVSTLCYVFIGSAGLPDLPYGQRLAEIQDRDPTQLSPSETLARLEQLVREQPEDPQPHFFIGEMMRAQGREDDAVRAYQSALRRDPGFVPAIVALADSLTRLAGGKVGDEAKRIYARAVALDPGQVRAGFMAGLSDWQSGDRALARTRWQNVANGLSEADPKRAMLDALVAQAEAGDIQ